MSVQMNIAEAKAKLAELIARAEAGETVAIARDGEPVVTLAPVRRRTVQLGRFAHLGPLANPDSLLEPDSDLEKVMREPLPRP